MWRLLIHLAIMIGFVLKKTVKTLKNVTVKRLLDNNKAIVTYENDNEVTVNLYPSSRTPLLFLTLKTVEL